MLNVVRNPVRSELDRRPFASGGWGRPLRVIIDEQTVSESPARDLLFALAERPALEVFSTAQRERRIEVSEFDETRGLREVDYVLPGGGGERRGLFSNWPDKVADRVTGHSRTETERVLVVADAAASHDVDALVLRDPLLQSRHWSNLAKKANLCSIEQACGLAGLSLRANGDYVARMHEPGVGHRILDPRSYYRGAVHAAVPGLSEWHAAAEAIWRERDDPTLHTLVEGTTARLARALRARDYIAVRLRHPYLNDSWDEVEYFFESLLLFLTGAMDAAARYCHLIADVGGPQRHAGWQKPGWPKKLARSAPELSPLLAPSAALPATARLLGVLRNHIHEAPLSSEQYGPGPEILDHQIGLIALDHDEGETVAAAATLLGGEQRWGIGHSFKYTTVELPIFCRIATLTVIESLAPLAGALNCEARTPETAIAFNRRVRIPGRGYEPELRLLTGLGDLAASRT